MQLEEKHPYSLSHLDNKYTNLSNYILKVHSSFNASEVSTVLFAFDSNDIGCEEN